jgi:ribose transport system substrate-binding protein
MLVERGKEGTRAGRIAPNLAVIHPIVQGSKDMIKKVMDGDKLMPVDVLYPPAMVGTAMVLTAANFYDQVPVRGSFILDATLVSKENAKDFYFSDSPF